MVKRGYDISSDLRLAKAHKKHLYSEMRARETADHGRTGFVGNGM